jgi:hypothetical protein
MGDFLDKVKNFADQHDDKVDEALEKIGEQADQRTGHEHTEQIDKIVDLAQEHTGPREP